MQANSYTAGSKTIAFSEPCDYFHEGKAKASTLSLSVLVAIEMFNALNALSEVSYTSFKILPNTDWDIENDLVTLDHYYPYSLCFLLIYEFCKDYSGH